MSKMTFHERFGEVSVAQLRAYSAHNVSQSDHDSLITFYSEGAHDTITKVVKDPRNHMPGTKLFSWHTWYSNNHSN